MTVLSPIIDHLKAGKKVTFFQGAGVSTGAGIPDFRSPETGLYANLSKLNLPYAEAVFDIDYFKSNPKPFYTLAEELYPGKFQPTSFHYFIRLVQDKNLLRRVYTQNIDTLERVAGVKDEFIVEAHGSFAKNHCIKCKTEMSVKQVREFMTRDEIPRCGKCKGYVKPDIVFFGESLPVRFFDAWEEDNEEVEFAIVAGTSLTVYPFASLPSELGEDVSRVLINKEVVGDFDYGNERDLILLDDCDKVVDELVDALGWGDEMERVRRGRYGFGDEGEGEGDEGENEVEKIVEGMKKVGIEVKEGGDEGEEKDEKEEEKEEKDEKEKDEKEKDEKEEDEKEEEKKEKDKEDVGEKARGSLTEQSKK